MRGSSLYLAKAVAAPEFMQDYRMFISSHYAVEHAKQELARYLETGSGTDAAQVSVTDVSVAKVSVGKSR